MSFLTRQTIEKIHNSGRKMVLAIAGGGSRAIADLLTSPGGSRTVLEAVVPYAPAACDSWLGGKPDQYCSNRTARALAMAALIRAWQLVEETDLPACIGIGCTASLASDRPKRGGHRVHVAWQTTDRTVVESLVLEKDTRDRAAEEEIAAAMVLKAAAEAAGIPGQFDLSGGNQVPASRSERPSLEWVQRHPCHESIVRREHLAPPEWTELLTGQRDRIYYPKGSSSHRVPDSSQPVPAILFPGAFNPSHIGHHQMARIAAEYLGQPVWFEMSIANVDKPPLDYIEISDRLNMLSNQPIVLTQAARFMEKAIQFPGATFLVGTDTLTRIAHVKYYGNQIDARDAAIGILAAHGCRFLVFGRVEHGTFIGLDDLDLPPNLRALCEGISETDFRADISSTLLRNGNHWRCGGSE